MVERTMPVVCSQEIWRRGSQFLATVSFMIFVFEIAYNKQFKLL
jgi:hypothetical protein